MWRKSSNNPWIPPQGINSAAIAQIGGQDVAPGQRFPGQLGAIWIGNNADALKASNVNGSGGGTLYMGAYQWIKWASGVTTVTKGQLVFWDTLANNGQATYTVTATASAAAAAQRAGVALFTETAAGGKYSMIQIGGMGQMLYGTTPGPIGQVVVQATAADTPLLTVSTVNTFLDGTAFGNMVAYKAVVGTAYETPVAATVLRVWMNMAGFFVNASS